MRSRLDGTSAEDCKKSRFVNSYEGPARLEAASVYLKYTYTRCLQEHLYSPYMLEERELIRL